MYYLFALVLFAASVSGGVVPRERYPLLLLSFDGVSAEEAKNLSSWTLFKSKAAAVDFVKSVFPSNTLSTHFSIATGEKPAVHGVIGNLQFDKNDKKTRPNQYRHVKDIKPIWIQNESLKRNSGTMMWPGSQFKFGGRVKDKKKSFKINSSESDEEDEENDGSLNDDDNYYGGKRADYHVDYKPKTMNWITRADTMMEWLTEEEPANLVMAYFENFEINDPSKREEIKDQHIKQVDGIIEYIYDELVDKELDSKVDIIVNFIEGKEILVLDDILEIENKENNIISLGPLAYIKPEKKDYDNVLEQLIANSENGKKYKIYKKPELKWHGIKFDALEKIITLVASRPYTFYTQQNLDKIKQKHGLAEKESTEKDVKVNDIEEASENGFFYGMGPSFRDDVFLEGQGFDLDEIYPLIKKLIDLPLKSSSSVQKNNDLDNVVKKLLEPGVLK